MVLAVPTIVLPVAAVCAAPVPDFDMAADPDFLAVFPDSSDTSMITLTSLNTFAGTVDLSASSDSDLLSPFLDQTSVVLSSDMSDSVTLTVSADPTILPGFYLVTVDGSSDSLFHSALVSVLVPEPDFSVEAAPTFLTLDPGDSDTSTIMVSSENAFAGTVSLSTTISPTPDLTASLSSETVDLVAGGSATVIMTVDSTVSTPAGSYMVSIDGTFDSIVRSTAVFVTVTGPDFVMFPDPFFLEIGPGSSGSSTITLTSMFGFSGTVDLDLVPPPPDGFTAVLDPTSVALSPGGLAISTLMVTVDIAVVPPAFALIHVVGFSGDKARSTSVFVLVPGPGINVTATPNTLAIDPGSSGGSTITVASLFGFEGTVTLTTSSSDPCLDVSLSLESVTLSNGGTAESTLLITVDGVTPTGTYFVGVDGVGPEGSFAFDFDLVVVTVGGVDTTAPTWPVGSSLIFSEVGQTSVTLSWTAAIDDVGVETYEILQDGEPVAPVPGTETSSTITGLLPGDTYIFQIVALDAAGNFEFGPSAPVTTAGPTNNPPVLDAIVDKTTDEGTLLTFTATATDLDGDLLTFTLGPGYPAGALISPSGGFAWTPSEAQGPGVFALTVTVSDGSATDSETFEITVGEANLPPVLAPIGAKTTQETIPLLFTATASDPDLPSQTLTFTLGSATGTFPSGAALSTSGAFSWTPTAEQGPGTYQARITVSDGSTSDFEDITITVTETPVNNPPVLATIGAKAASEGSTLTFTVTATDLDTGQTLTLTATGLPSGATFSSTPAFGTVTGTLTWTPSEAQGQSVSTVTFTVSDGAASDSEAVTVTVAEANTAPVLAALGDTAVQAGAQLTFTVVASDSDDPANTLTYTLESGAPAGASITTNGVFSWTPSANQGPGTYTITVRVSDGTDSRTKTFTVTVNAPQQAPSAPAPFYQQYWWVFVILALVLAGIPVAMKVRGRPKPKT